MQHVLSWLQDAAIHTITLKQICLKIKNFGFSLKITIFRVCNDLVPSVMHAKVSLRIPKMY